MRYYCYVGNLHTQDIIYFTIDAVESRIRHNNIWICCINPYHLENFGHTMRINDAKGMWDYNFRPGLWSQKEIRPHTFRGFAMPLLRFKVGRALLNQFVLSPLLDEQFQTKLSHSFETVQVRVRLCDHRKTYVRLCESTVMGSNRSVSDIMTDQKIRNYVCAALLPEYHQVINAREDRNEWHQAQSFSAAIITQSAIIGRREIEMLCYLSIT